MMVLECKIKPGSESCRATVVERYSDGRPDGQHRFEKVDCSEVDHDSLNVARGDALRGADTNYPYHINIKGYVHSDTRSGRYQLASEVHTPIRVAGQQVGTKVISGPLSYSAKVECQDKPVEEETPVDLPHMRTADFVLAGAFLASLLGLKSVVPMSSMLLISLPFLQ